MPNDTPGERATGTPPAPPPSPPRGGRYDVAIVGAGPGGLHAALKAAVLNHTVLLVDKGRRFSRVSQAPSLMNVPGSPGISGADLLKQGHRDLEKFAKTADKRLVHPREDTEVVGVERKGDGFHLRMRPTAGGDEEEAVARVLVLATGLVDRKPGIERFWKEGHHTLEHHIHTGGVGYCILCEGWSVEDARVGVLGWNAEAAQIAIDLRQHFDGDVTLLTDGCPLDRDVDGEALEDARVRVEPRVIEDFHDEGPRVAIHLDGGDRETFEKLFIHQGWYKVNNELAVQLGAATTGEGFVRTTGNLEVVDDEGTPVEGLYAIGDLRDGGWKQAVLAWGDAESAIIHAYAHRLPD